MDQRFFTKKYAVVIGNSKVGTLERLQNMYREGYEDGIDLTPIHRRGIKDAKLYAYHDKPQPTGFRWDIGGNGIFRSKSNPGYMCVPVYRKFVVPYKSDTRILATPVIGELTHKEGKTWRLTIVFSREVRQSFLRV